MPTSNPQVKVTLTPAEFKRLQRELREGESVSNLVRRKLKLPPLKQGAPEGNQNAAGSGKRNDTRLSVDTAHIQD